jgi:hypothetical protein
VYVDRRSPTARVGLWLNLLFQLSTVDTPHRAGLPRVQSSSRLAVRAAAVATKFASFDAMVASFEEPVVVVGEKALGPAGTPFGCGPGGRI